MTEHNHHVVIVGGGFGGLYATKELADSPVEVTLVDKNNYHLFQPLLYQVATGGLSPGNIASPLRAIFSSYENVNTLMAEMVDVVPKQKKIIFRDGELSYDTLVIATGSSHHYFGNDEWENWAPGLKSIENALDIRRRILLAFEAAERETDPERRRAWMTFKIVGAGPTGVEMAGALSELANSTLKTDFRNIDPKEARIVLVEGLERVLPAYPPELSKKAENALKNLGVEIRTNTFVTDIEDDKVTIKKEDKKETIRSKTVIWAAGVKASPIGKVLADRTGVELDKSGSVKVESDFSIAGYPDIFVIGDLAHYAHNREDPLPGLAPVAMQEGGYVANLIKKRIEGETPPKFEYKDKGKLSVIGRNAAVADFGEKFRFNGFLAWLLWVFVHIQYMVEFDNKVIVLFQWAWNYLTKNLGARLIAGEDPFPLVDTEERKLESVIETRKTGS